MPATTSNLIAQGALTTVLGAELNSLASGAFATLGAAFSNAFGVANFGGYLLADVKLNLAAYSGTPTAGGYLALWFISAIDGANYDDAESTISSGPDAMIPIDAKAGGPYQRTVRGVYLPVGSFKCLAQNVGTGIAFAASGNTVILRPTSFQSQ